MDLSKDLDSQQVITSSDPAVDMKDSDSQTATLSPSRHGGSLPVSQTYLQKLATKGRRLGKAVLDAAFSIATYLKPGASVQKLLGFMLHVIVARGFIISLDSHGADIVNKNLFHWIGDAETKLKIRAWVHVGCVALDSVLILFTVGRVMWMTTKI